VSKDIRLWDLGPSPNSKKVRLALGFKGVDYERIAVDPADRDAVVEVSGQPLTPVLAHGETIIYDSGAILRYLDANVKTGPRLFSETREGMKEIEGWEAWSRQQLGSQVGTLFGQAFAEVRSPEVIAAVNERFNALAGELEGELGETSTLVGDRHTAADIFCASYVSLAVMTPSQAASHPILSFFAESLQLDQRYEKLREWYRAINKFDQ
jgi:glutathione S-transferase